MHEEHLTNSCIYQNYLEIRKGKVMKKYIFTFKLVKASSAIHGYVSHRTGWKKRIYGPISRSRQLRIDAQPRTQSKQLSSLHHGPISRSRQLSSMHHGRNDIHAITIPSLVIVRAPSTWIIFFFLIYRLLQHWLQKHQKLYLGKSCNKKFLL